jgi:hypothetical protein
MTAKLAIKTPHRQNLFMCPAKRVRVTVLLEIAKHAESKLDHGPQ